MGIVVADFTWIGAGSYTTKILADFGADVVKVESRERLDSLRNAKPFKDGKPGINRSGYFADRNSSKRSVTLNLKKERGRELARQIIRQSDIVANNFTPGVMERFGLGYDDVRKIRPDVIYLAMSMHGQTGPEAAYLGYGLTMGAVTGLHHLCGLPDREPAGTGTNYADHVPNPCHGAFAVLAALRHRRRTGRGQLIDLAQIEPTISLLGPAVLQYTANNEVAGRVGNEQVPYAPHGVYPCLGNDRWIAITADGERPWRALMQVLEAADVCADPRFSSAVARWRNRHVLDALIAELTAKREPYELMKALQSRKVSAGVVQDASDVLRRDPQLAHRQHWVYLDHQEMGRTVYGALPCRLSRTPGYPRMPAPLLGEHTEECLRDRLGLDAEEIATLRRDGVLT